MNQPSQVEGGQPKETAGKGQGDEGHVAKD